MTKEESIANRVKALMAKNGYTKFQATAIVRNEDSKPKAQMGFQQPWYNQNYNLDNTIQSQAMSPQQNFSTGNQDYLRMAHTPTQAQNPAYQSMVNPSFAPGNYNEWDKDNNGVPDTMQKVEGNPALDPATQPQEDSTNSPKAEQINNTNVANLYGGVDLEGALAYAGRGFGTGNAWQAGTGTALSAVKGARNFLSGFASGQSDKQTYEDYMKKLNEDQRQTEYVQQGGKIKNSEVMAMNAITDNPNGQINLEGGEFVKRANGMVQPVVGEPHIKNGKIAEGVDAQLEGGDKVLSDYVKLRPNDIKELKDRYDISLKKGDTPAKAQTKFDAKIGLKKEEEGLATLAEKLEKALKIKDITTQELSVQSLQSKIAKQNEKIAPLKEVSAMAFEDFFMRQEEIPKKGGNGDLFDKNGKKVTEYAEQKEVAQQGGEQQDQVAKIVQAYAQASGQDPQQIMQQLQQMQPEEQQQAIQAMVQELQGGQSQEQPEMMAQQGGLMEMASKYGISPQRAQELIAMQQGGQPQEQGQDQQMQQIMQQVAQALQSGADPNEVTQQLTEMGIPPEVAQQIIEQVIGQLQGQGAPQEQMEGQQEMVAQQGGKMYAQGGGLTYEQIVARNNAAGTNTAVPGLWTGDTASEFYTPYTAWESYLGRTPRELTTQEIYQKGVSSDLTPQLSRLIETGEMALTNKHRELLKKAGVKNADKITSYTDLKKDDKKKLGKDFVLGGYVDTYAGHRGVSIQPGDMTQEEYSKLPKEKYDRLTDTEGRQIYAKYDKDGKLQKDDKGNFAFYYPKRMGEPEKKVDPTKVTEETVAEVQGENKISPAQVNNKTVFPMLPDDLRLPPSALAPLRKPEINLGRLEPNKATIEPYLANQAQQQLTAREQLSATGLPPQIQEALSAQQFATGQMSANDAISKTENFNRTNQMQVDQFNIGQRAKEDIMNEQFSQTYSNQMLQGMANTERDLRAYYNEGNAINNAKWNHINDVNLTNAKQEQYQYNPGVGVTFNNNRAGDLSTKDENFNWANATAEEIEKKIQYEIAKSKKNTYKNQK